MTKKKMTGKRLAGVNGKLLQKGGRKSSKTLPKVETDSELRKKSKNNMSNAIKMAKIEKYAKENKVTITQAMVTFM